jgi:hypothetical protein
MVLCRDELDQTHELHQGERLINLIPDNTMLDDLPQISGLYALDIGLPRLLLNIALGKLIMY